MCWKPRYRIRRHTAAVRRFWISLVLVIGMLVGQTPVAYPDSRHEEQTSSSEPLSLITPQMVQPMIVKLSGDEFEGRGAGYAGEKKAAKLIAVEFKRTGLRPAGAHGSFFQEFKFSPHHPVVPFELLTSRNVLGFIEGEDPVLKQEIVVVGAHYDGQGRLGQADPF